MSRPVSSILLTLSLVLSACAAPQSTDGAVLTEVQTAASQSALTPDDAYALLVEGNQRFLQGRTLARDLQAQAAASASGQYPYAVVLACIDSRVAPEIFFDAGVGDLFVPRVAGNFVNSDILGSIEFATAVAGSKVVAVVGHTACGAVKGACDGVDVGHIGPMVRNLDGAVAATPTDGPRDGSNEAFVDAVAAENVRRTMRALVEQSEILRERVANGQLRIVGGMHQLATGEVRWF